MGNSAGPPIGGRVLDRANRLFDRVAPLLAAVAVAGATALSLDDTAELTFVTTPLAVVVGVVSGLATLVARRTLWPLLVMAALGSGVLLQWPALMVASYYAGSRLRRRRELGPYAFAVGVALSTAVVLSLTVDDYRSYWDLPNALSWLLVFVGLPLVVGLLANARRQLLAALHERADRLEREQAARANQARAEERARIAREMHDVVAHRISLIVLHAGALEVSTKDEPTVRAADLIRTTGREALAELRTVLGVLRSPNSGTDSILAPQPVLSDLDALLQQSRAVGIDVRRRDEGEVRALPATVERTAYRVIQEALTNVHKHAGAVHAEVVVRYQADRLEVAVTNTQTRGDNSHSLPGNGYGLVGLAERVQLLGGRLSAQARTSGGFVVHAVLPTPTEPAAEPVRDRA